MTKANNRKGVKRKAKTALRKKIRKSPLTYAVPVFFLLVGLALGYFLTPVLAGDSGIVLVGEKVIAVPLDTVYFYRDEGVRFTYFGIDCGAYVSVRSNIPKGADGTYALDTSAPGTYYIAYTSTHPLFEREVRIVRTFVVGGEA